MDKWILSRLSLAVESCNTSFENYELNGATTACYNFWLYDLCDVYLVMLNNLLSIQLKYILINMNSFRSLSSQFLHQMMKIRFKLFKMFYFVVWTLVCGYYHHLCHSLLKNFINDCHILIFHDILVYLLPHILKL